MRFKLLLSNNLVFLKKLIKISIYATFIFIVIFSTFNLIHNETADANSTNNLEEDNYPRTSKNDKNYLRESEVKTSSNGSITKLVDLVDVFLSQKKGTTQTHFIFEVTYINIRNEEPEENPRIHIDKKDNDEVYSFHMKKISEKDDSYEEGVKYEGDVVLDEIGKYEFSIYVIYKKNGSSSSYYHQTDILDGPIVLISEEEIQVSISKGIGIVLSITALITFLFGLSSKKPRSVIMLVLSFLIGIIFVVFLTYFFLSPQNSYVMEGILWGCILAAFILTVFGTLKIFSLRTTNQKNMTLLFTSLSSFSFLYRLFISNSFVENNFQLLLIIEQIHLIYNFFF